MPRTTWRLRLLAIAALATLGVFATACQLVASGQLQVKNDLSGLASDTAFYAWAHEEGDVYPPPGSLAIDINGSDFGDPPNFGMNG